MTEEAKAATTEAEEAKETTTDTTDTTEGGGRTYGQVDVDSITAKVRKTEEAKRAKLEAELTKLREQTMSEQERAIAEARAEGAAEAAKEAEALRRQLALSTRLAAQGVSPAQIDGLVRLAPGDLDPDEAVEALKETYAPLFGTTKPRVADPGGAQRGGGKAMDYSPDAVKAHLESLPTDAARKRYLTEHARDIRNWRIDNGYASEANPYLRKREFVQTSRR